jgi:glycosyltransferase involved in cell wall biosynthesis
MRIAVDGRHLGAGRGVARVTRCLLPALAGALPEADVVAVVPGRAPLPALPHGVSVARTTLPSRAVHGAGALAGRPRLDDLAGGADVVWLPAPAPVAVSGDVPLVLTVHDRSWELRPADFTAYERLWHRLARPRALARRATRVVTDSAWVRDDLVEAWGLDPARTTIVPLGAGLDVAAASDSGGAAASDGPRDARPYLLAVGALEPRKAPDVLARAYALARTRGLTADLLVAGAGRAAGPLDGVDGVRLLGTVADAELARLYQGALALVHPALLEGFGLPPLEAALRGVPTVGSNLPPLRETLGDAALLVAPGDADALATALVQIAADAPARARLGAAARERAGRYTWEAAGRGLAEVLKEAACA